MKKDRSIEILDIMSSHPKIEVAELSRLLDVSQVTVRKDLDRLESKGLIKRIHGYAELNDTDDLEGRLAFHYDLKYKIASEAAELVHDGDTIFIESGSCCALLASVLSESGKNVTIVTNSAFIAGYVRHSQNLSIVLVGGIYQKDSQCLVGPMVREASANYNVPLFFIGTDGYSERTGFTNKDQMRAQAVRDMAHSAENVVVLTESDKFKAAGTIPMNVKNQPKYVITDNRLEDKMRQELTSSGIEVIIVD